MASYHREYLIPYLQNVCALHLADEKLKQKAIYLRQKITTLQTGQDNPLPAHPVKKPVLTLGRILSFLFGLCGIPGMGVCFLVPDLDSGLRIAFFTLSFCITILFCGGSIYLGLQAAQANRRKQSAYKRKRAEYERISQENQLAQQQIPALQTDLQKCFVEKHRVQTLLLQVYNANIIPRCYRNISVATYLYDWFSSCRSTDLDTALNMYVLEEKHNNMDWIIDKNAPLILKQCMALADQTLAQERHFQMLHHQLEQEAADPETQMACRSMTDGISAAAAYFAAAEFLRKI